jgi:L-ribulose-5-phosphate 3-epimerase
MNRRSFLASAPAALALAQTSVGQRLPIRKAMVYGNLPEKGPDGHTLTPRERFQMARDAGFEQIECHTTSDPKAVQEFTAASRETGVKIHSVMNSDHWKYPLSSPDPSVVAKSMKGMETSLRNAKEWGAETVLLVPAVVNKDIGYREAWKRSQAQIHKLIPLAAELKVIIAIEEVWNHFLLSPIEFARYVDDFKSPWVKAYFDVGNVALFSFPQDWIRILGPRIVKVHLKDFSFRKDVASWDMLRDGDLDWKAIYRAFADIGYHGTASIEIDMRDEAQLREASRRFDLIVTGA